MSGSIQADPMSLSIEGVVKQTDKASVEGANILTDFNEVSIKVLEEKALMKKILERVVMPAYQLRSITFENFIIVTSLGMTNVLFAEQLEKIRIVASLYFGLNMSCLDCYGSVVKQLIHIIKSNGKLTIGVENNEKEKHTVEARYSFYSHKNMQLHKFTVITLSYNARRQAIARKSRAEIELITKSFIDRLLEQYRKTLEPNEQLLIVENITTPTEFNCTQSDMANAPSPRLKHFVCIHNSHTYKKIFLSNIHIDYIERDGYWPAGENLDPWQCWQVLTGQ